MFVQTGYSTIYFNINPSVPDIHLHKVHTFKIANISIMVRCNWLKKQLQSTYLGNYKYKKNKLKYVEILVSIFKKSRIIIP